MSGRCVKEGCPLGLREHLMFLFSFLFGVGGECVTPGINLHGNIYPEWLDWILHSPIKCLWLDSILRA